jgi:hypothetical protein
VASGCSQCVFEIATPDPLPDGRVGANYVVRMQASMEGCDGEAWWSSENSLPPGLKLQKGGSLYGIPSEAGTYSFDVTAILFSIAGDDPAAVIRRYTLTIHPA